MKIISWNCQGAYRKKSAQIAAYKPDIAIIQECERDDKLIFPSGIVQPTSNKWFGNQENYRIPGISIMSYTGLELSVHESYNAAIEWCIPLKVSSHPNLVIIAMLANIKDVSQVVDRYRELISSGSTIIMGDFNSYQTANKTNKKLTEVVSVLKKLNMVSVYHELNEDYGAETRDTYFRYRRKEEPAHIDYCFLPKNWLRKVNTFEIGKYEAWTEHSDHSPLFLEINL